MRYFLAFLTSVTFVFTGHPQQENNSDFYGSEYFNIGMFSVIGNMAGVPQPGSAEFRNELNNLFDGTNNNNSAINTLHTYGHYISDTDFWTTYLNDIHSVSDELNTLGDCRFIYIDSNSDSILSQAEIDTFITHFENILSLPNSDHVTGWYIADEPSAHEYQPEEVLKIYNVIKPRDNRPVYIAEAPGETDYSRFMCDILIIDNYYYTINDYSPLATLAWWSELISGARLDLINAGRQETEIHALLVLGEEIFPDSLNESLMATHGMTHAAIRHVMELGVDGIWFYAWRAGVIDSEDAAPRWLSQEYYAEAVETEIHDTDYLVTVFSNNEGSDLVISNIADGQSPVEGTTFSFNNKIGAVTSGDLIGSNNIEGIPVLYDLNYEIDNGFRSNCDGDDELITAFVNGNIFISESANQPDETLINPNTGSISTMTSGDFDGDGDYEIVTALLIDDQSIIYLSDDGAAGSITQYQLFTSNELIVTGLTAGDFNADGRDELVTGIENLLTAESYIYIDDIGISGAAVNEQPWFGPDNNYLVTALTAGNFTNDNNFNDMLVFALSNSDLQQTRIYSTRVNNFSFDSSFVFFGPDEYWHVTSMTCGDFTDDFKFTKDLIISLSNSTFDHTAIYRSSDPLQDGIGTDIYDSGYPSNQYVSAITSASFRESNHPVTIVEDELDEKYISLSNYILYQNYPNPFNPSTKIKFTIQAPPSSSPLLKGRTEVGFATLKVYDVLGNEVATLVNEEKPAGEYEIEFSATGGGKDLTSGVYFYQLRIRGPEINSGQGIIQTKKMLLLK